MKGFSKNLLVVFRNEFMTEQAFEHEVEAITEILLITDSSEHFCTATELVDRNRITSNPNKILKEAKHYRLRPFRFLINKN
jgi:hypothetical protein